MGNQCMRFVCIKSGRGRVVYCTTRLTQPKDKEKYRPIRLPTQEMTQKPKHATGRGIWRYRKIQVNQSRAIASSSSEHGLGIGRFSSCGNGTKTNRAVMDKGDLSLKKNGKFNCDKIRNLITLGPQPFSRYLFTVNR
jgi:hypothetical protein